MDTANQILESLDPTEIRQRIEALEKEKRALLILHRAVIRLERQRPPRGETCKRQRSQGRAQ